MKCAICGEEIPERFGWDKGNNAEPVAKGRCCDECNRRRVLPARIGQIAKG